MQDRFSAEIMLVNQLRTKLIDDGWELVQLVCSGGQAHFSISYRNNGRLKNIFPDVVAFNEKNIFIGEIKEKFDEKDYLKLLELKMSNDGLAKLVKVISLRAGNCYNKDDVIFNLIHSELTSHSISSVNQYVFDNEGFYFISSS